MDVLRMWFLSKHCHHSTQLLDTINFALAPYAPPDAQGNEEPNKEVDGSTKSWEGTAKENIGSVGSQEGQDPLPSTKKIPHPLKIL